MKALANLVNAALVITTLGELICRWRGHAFGRPTFHHVAGWVKQCPRCLEVRQAARPMADGYQTHTSCDVCQCYPEGRIDCPRREACLARMPEYRNAESQA